MITCEVRQWYVHIKKLKTILFTRKRLRKYFMHTIKILRGGGKKKENRNLLRVHIFASTGFLKSLFHLIV